MFTDKISKKSVWSNIPDDKVTKMNLNWLALQSDKFRCEEFCANSNPISGNAGRNTWQFCKLKSKLKAFSVDKSELNANL